MFECALCVDTIMRTQKSRVLLFWLLRPHREWNVSVLVERVGQFWREAAVDSWPQDVDTLQDVDTSQDVDRESVDSGAGAEAGQQRHHRHQRPGHQDQAGRGGHQGHGESAVGWIDEIRLGASSTDRSEML